MSNLDLQTGKGDLVNVVQHFCEYSTISIHDLIWQSSYQASLLQLSFYKSKVSTYHTSNVLKSSKQLLQRIIF